eukprot:15439682-Alexandrium_andersonii.AAC.1
MRPHLDRPILGAALLCPAVRAHPAVSLTLPDTATHGPIGCLSAPLGASRPPGHPPLEGLRTAAHDA